MEDPLGLEAALAALGVPVDLVAAVNVLLPDLEEAPVVPVVVPVAAVAPVAFVTSLASTDEAPNRSDVAAAIADDAEASSDTELRPPATEVAAAPRSVSAAANDARAPVAVGIATPSEVAAAYATETAATSELKIAPMVGRAAVREARAAVLPATSRSEAIAAMVDRAPKSSTTVDAAASTFDTAAALFCLVHGQRIYPRDGFRSEGGGRTTAPCARATAAKGTVKTME